MRIGFFGSIAMLQIVASEGSEPKLRKMKSNSCLNFTLQAIFRKSNQNKSRHTISRGGYLTDNHEPNPIPGAAEIGED